MTRRFSALALFMLPAWTLAAECPNGKTIAESLREIVETGEIRNWKSTPTRAQSIHVKFELPNPGAELKAQLNEIKTLLESISQTLGRALPLPAQVELRVSADAITAATPNGRIDLRLDLFRSANLDSKKAIVAHEYGHVLLHERIRTSNSDLAWIFDGDRNYGDAGNAEYKAYKRKDKELFAAYKSAKESEAGVEEEMRWLRLQEQLFEENRTIIRHYDNQKKIATRFYNQVLMSYDEFFADLVAVAAMDDPKAISRALMETLVENETDHLRDFSATAPIPEIFSQRRESGSTFILPQIDAYFHLTPTRRAIWAEYFAGSARRIDRGKLVEAVADSIVSEASKIYADWSAGGNLPSVAEMNTRLFKEVRANFVLKGP